MRERFSVTQRGVLLTSVVSSVNVQRCHVTPPLTDHCHTKTTGGSGATRANRRSGAAYDESLSVVVVDGHDDEVALIGDLGDNGAVEDLRPRVAAVARQERVELRTARRVVPLRASAPSSAIGVQG